jgi:hypothetical protein
VKHADAPLRIQILINGVAREVQVVCGVAVVESNIKNSTSP